MNKYKRAISSFAIATLLMLGLVLLLDGPPQTVWADPDSLFVSPGGIGDCSQDNPCTLHSAMMQAKDDDTVWEPPYPSECPHGSMRSRWPTGCVGL